MDLFFVFGLVFFLSDWANALNKLKDNYGTKSCQYWAGLGYCTKSHYKTWMDWYCKKSCEEWTKCRKFDIHWWTEKDSTFCKQILNGETNCEAIRDFFVRDMVRTECQLTCRFCNPPPTKPPTTLGTFVVPKSCGRRDPKFTRIVGGKDAKLGEWPWQVLIDVKGDKYDRWCGGSLITDEWVLTAAHCFNKYKDPANYTVIAGDLIVNETSKWEQRRDVAQIIVHPDYTNDDNQWYDVALLRLKNKITLNSNVRTICLAGDEYGVSVPVGTKCTISGWGKIRAHAPHHKAYPQVMQHAEVPIVSNKKCDALLKYYDIHSSQLCAGYDQGRIDSCGGDSGGPLACEHKGIWYVVGISSYGIECGRPYTPGVYSNVKTLRSFVDKYVKQSV